MTSQVRDIEEGFDEEGVDALFLDVREPWYYLEQAHAALKGGGFFGCILPTTNQITVLLRHLPRHGFGFVQVEELILRPYKAVADRLRPFDKIIAHTGYLVFARALLESEEETSDRGRNATHRYPNESQKTATGRIRLNPPRFLSSVPPSGLEPETFWSATKRSIQLSHGGISNIKAANKAFQYDGSQLALSNRACSEQASTPVRT